MGALLLGGFIAAAIAAWLVRLLHPRVLGAAVGGFIVLTNGRTLMRGTGIETEVQVVAYAAIIALWVVALLVAACAVRAEGGRLLAASGDESCDGTKSTRERSPCPGSIRSSWKCQRPMRSLNRPQRTATGGS